MRHPFAWFKPAVDRLAHMAPPRFHVAVGVFVVLYTAAAVTYSVIVQSSWNHRIRCLESYANDLTTRNQALSKAGATFARAQDARTLALDRVLTEAIHQQHAAVQRDLPAYEKAAHDYQVASANLKSVVAKHPQPAISEVKC